MKKARAKSTSRKTTSRKTKFFNTNAFLISLTSGFAVILATVLFVPDKAHLSQSVAGVTVMKGMFMEATVPLPGFGNAESYNIYYKRDTDSTFTNAVRNIPRQSSSYTISYLKKGAQYQYKISAVGKNGSEFWFSPITSLTNLVSM